MSLNLITDRTAADLAAAREIIAKVQRGETLTEAEQSQFDAGLRGCYNATDLNRVEAAVKQLAAELNAAGYAVAVEPVLKGGLRLPSGYTELEYIESSGTQYIDTGVVPNHNTAVMLDIDILNADNWGPIFGSRDANVTNEYCMFAHNPTSVYQDGYGNVAHANISVSSVLGRQTINKALNNTYINGELKNSFTAATFQGTYPMWLFQVNSGGSAVAYKISGRIYRAVITKSSTIVRDFVPCKNPSGAVGLYDLVGKQFYTTPLAEEPVTLPSGYTQLEYLQSTGTQYIDTGVVGSSNTRVVVDFAITGLGSGTTFVFGAQGTDSVRYTLGVTSAGVFRSDYGTEMTSGSAVALNTRYRADKNQNVCTINDSTITSAAQTFTGTTNIYLFARSYSSLSYSQAKLYSCQIYDNGTLMRNMVPAKNSSGTLGMYDTVNGTFYANAGTGTFTAGAEIVGFTAGAEIGALEDREWRESDIVRLSQWRQYLANVQALRDAYYTLAETGQLPDAEDRLDYIGANTIEKILADIDLLINGMKSIYRRAGTFSAGGNYVRQMIRSV